MPSRKPARISCVIGRIDRRHATPPAQRHGKGTELSSSSHCLGLKIKTSALSPRRKRAAGVTPIARTCGQLRRGTRPIEMVEDRSSPVLVGNAPPCLLPNMVPSLPHGVARSAPRTANSRRPAPSCPREHSGPYPISSRQQRCRAFSFVRSARVGAA